VTLATMEIVRGLAFLASGGKAVSILAERFYTLGSGSFLGLNYPIWIMFLAFVIFGTLLNRTVFGRNVLAIGGNPEAARLAGVPVDRVRIGVFVLQGSSPPLRESSWLRESPRGSQTRARVWSLRDLCLRTGGVSLSGGVATVAGVIIGVLIMGAAQNASICSMFPLSTNTSCAAEFCSPPSFSTACANPAGCVYHSAVPAPQVNNEASPMSLIAKIETFRVWPRWLFVRIETTDGLIGWGKRAWRATQRPSTARWSTSETG